MGFGVEMNLEMEEVEMRLEEEGTRLGEEEEGIRYEVQWVEMSQLAQTVFPIIPVVCNMDFHPLEAWSVCYFHLCIVPIVSLLPVHTYYKFDCFCGSSTRWPNDLVSHMYDRQLCAGLCIVVSDGNRFSLGSVHYISHSFPRGIHLDLEPGIALMLIRLPRQNVALLMNCNELHTPLIILLPSIPSRCILALFCSAIWLLNH